MFIAYVKQLGEGCDYTIGCAQALWRLEATTLEDAKKELRHRVIGELFDGQYEDGYWSEQELELILLLDVNSETSMPIGEWYADADRRASRQRIQMSEEAERGELERLRAKYSTD